jgi:uncharacterized protein (TIGR00369 family)
MSEPPVPRPEAFTRCYGCGRDNPRGLALAFHRDGDAVVAPFTPAPEHGGYGRLLHGGVTATLLDEAFGWATYSLLGKIAMTTDLAISFHAPLHCGEALTVRGFVERHDERTAVVHAEIHSATGRLAATGIGTLRFISRRVVERIGGFTAE